MEREYKKLRGRILEKYGTNENFANAIGTTIQTVSAKLTGKSGFSQNNIVKWSNALGISADEVGAHFFEEKLSKS